MNLHEYQAKGLIARYNVPVPEGYAADTADEAAARASALPGSAWMVKAQVHAGGRGKAGGVKMAKSAEQAREYAAAMLGTRLVTKQTTADGQPITKVLVEATTEIADEFYLSMLIDRARRQPVIMASAAGGMDIEEVAASEPDKIVTEYVDPAAGLQPYQVRRIGFALGLDKAQLKQLDAMLRGLYECFVANDLAMLELNPLVRTRGGDLIALDCKIGVDESALYRHPDLAELHDPSQDDESENRAREHDLNYVALDGNIACMVNGAGLAMGTMDIIKLYGGEPANFLDVGGTATANRVAEAFKIITSTDRVQAILVNIFGGIVRCDLIAEGIIQAVKEVGVTIPVIVRLEGTNVERGRELLDASDVEVISAASLADAAEKAVAATR